MQNIQTQLYQNNTPISEKEFEIKSTHCYDHTDTKSTLIEAYGEKDTTTDRFAIEKELQALFILAI